MLDRDDIEFLSGLSIFAGLRADVLARIGHDAELIEVQRDQCLYREGEPAKEIAVVRSGQVDIIKRTDRGAQVCIASLGPGHVVGEMSLFDIQPRSAAVWAHAPAQLVLLRHGDLARLYRTDKESFALLVLNIARELSMRLRRVDATLANILGLLDTTPARDMEIEFPATHSRETNP